MVILILVLILGVLLYFMFKIKMEKDELETKFAVLFEEKEELALKNSKYLKEINKMNSDIEELYKVFESNPNIINKTNTIKNEISNKFDSLVHSAFITKLEEELERKRRFPFIKFTVMDISLDFYDEYKSAYGDKVSKLITEINQKIQKHIRKIDILSKGKSEESIFLLLPMTDLRGAVVLAERIQDAVAKIDINIGAISLSISICEIENSAKPNVILGTLEQNKKLAIENGGNDIRVEKI